MTEVLHLRPLIPGDLPRLVELESELFGAGAWSAAMLVEELDGPGRWYVGAEVSTCAPEVSGASGTADTACTADGMCRSLIGYTGSLFDGEDTQVMTIGVDREHQGAGVGGRLLTALLDHAREVGTRAVLLEVRVDNDPALALYERFGFERMARRKRYYQPEDIDAWTMRLRLGPGPTAEATGHGAHADPAAEGHGR